MLIPEPYPIPHEKNTLRALVPGNDDNVPSTGDGFPEES